MPSWKKVVTWYSDPILNSLLATTYVSASEFRGPLFGTSSWAIQALTASYSTGSLSASYATQALSASYAGTASLAGFSISSSYSETASYAISSVSSSRAVSSSFADSASYAITASHALTASSADNFFVRGTLTAQTLVVQVITSSQELVTGSLTVQGPLNAIGGVTGSLVGTSSFAISSSYAVTASYAANVPATSSYALQALSASYAITSSFAANAQTASYILNAISSSYAGTASFVTNAISSSYPVAATGSVLYSTGPRSGPFSNSTHSIFLGSEAARLVTNAQYSNFIGYQAGYEANIQPGFPSDYSNFIGYQAGYQANIGTGNAIGWSAGYRADSESSNLIGNYAGAGLRQRSAVMIGNFPGYYATEAKYSIMIGTDTGGEAVSASNSVFIGTLAGNRATYASHSVLLGYYVGYNGLKFFGDSGIGPNNIIIGTNISLSSSRADSINIGGIIFGTGSYSNVEALYPLTGSVGNGKIGINVELPKYNLDVSGSGNYTNNLTATGSIRFPSLTNVSQTSIVSYDATTGQLYYQLTGSTTAGTASFVTASNVYGPFGSNSILSSSYAVSSSFATNTLTASHALTASSADNFLVRQNLTSSNLLVNGTITAQTLVVQTITSSTDFVTGSTRFGSQLTNTHQFTGSVSITGSLAINGVDYATTSASFATRILNNSSSIAQLSSSVLSLSSSLSSRITVNSSSISQLSSSFLAFSSSYNTGSFTGSFIGTASYALDSNLLDGRDSTVFATTGSNVFRGNQTVTGSVNVTGSTTLIGNNNLSGNTTISGSIVISGSQGITPATFQIYGDILQSGRHRFNPVTTTIDSSISASYVYVSGSTNDLYFTQNSNGYTNTTRLRWLEGNLYTGLLNGGLITTQSSTVYQVSSGSGIIVNLNASLNDNPYPTIQYLNWPNLSASIAPLSASFDQTFVAIQASGSSAAIYVQGVPYDNGQFNTLIPIGNVIHQNRSTINATATYPSVGYGYKQRSSDFIRAFGPLKISGLNTYPSGSSTGSLIVTSGTAYSDGRNYTTDPNDPSYVVDTGQYTSKIYRYYQSGSGFVYLTNGGAGFTTIDPGQYNNNGTLSPVANNKWSIQRVFYFPGGATKGIYVYYGNAKYDSQLEAIANITNEPFTEAPNTAAGAILSAYLILQGNADFTNTATYAIRQGGLFRSVGGSGGGGSVTTNRLVDLSDVSITSPTDYQPLVYNATTLKWENRSAISASVAGNASTATTASYALTASYVLNAISSSFATTASFINPLNQTLLVTGSVGITGSLLMSGSSAFSQDITVNSIRFGRGVGNIASNTVISVNGLAAITTGYDNIAIGGSTLLANNTGYENIAIGTQGLLSNTSGRDNTVVGFQSMRANTTGIRNTAVGVQALYDANGSDNAAFGGFSLLSSPGSSFSQAVGVGYFAGSSNRGNNNTFVGAFAGNDVTVGTDNTILGRNTGRGITSGSQNTILGANVTGLTSTLTNNIIIADGTGNQRIRVFNTGNTSIGYTTPTDNNYKLEVSGSGNFINGLTATGSIRFPSLTNVTQTNLVGYDVTTGQLFYQNSGSFTASTASFVTASNVFGPFGSNSILSASYAVSSSQAQNATTASYVLNAVSASFATSASLASTANNAKAIDIYSFGSDVDSYILMSNVIATTGVAIGGDGDLRYNASTNRLTVGNITATSLTGSLLGTSSFANNATSSSYALTASYALNSLSTSFATNALTASHALTASSADNFLVRQNLTASNLLVNGTITAQTLVVQTVTSSTDFVTGSTRFGSQLTNTHQFTGSVGITGSLSTFGNVGIGTSSPGTLLEIASTGTAAATVRLNAQGTGNATVQHYRGGAFKFEVGTGGGSDDYAVYNGAASSYSLRIKSTAGGDVYLNETTGSTGIGTTAPIAKFDVNGTANFRSSVNITGSLIAPSITGSLQGTASWAQNAISASFSTTASYVLNCVSASFASTASFVNPLNQTVVITGSINFADGAERQIIIPAGPNFTSGMTIGVSGSNSGNTSGGSLTLISGNSTGTGFAGNIILNGGATPGSTTTAVSGGNVSLNGGAITNAASGNGETAGSINLTGGNTARSGNTTGGNITLLGGSATTNGTGGSVIINPGNGATTGSIVLANVRGNVGIGTSTPTSKLTVSGSANISAAVTASTLLVSGSGTQRVTIIGSGSAQPIFTVQGSQGELFSITDSLSGSLFSVNDISGLPILEVFSDDTVLMGDYTAPSLNTTKRITSTTAGVNVIYSLPTSSYDGVFVDYTIRSGSVGRAGNFMAMWSGSTTDFTDNSINGFGTTTGFVFGASISGSNMVVTGSGATAGWTVKTIIRSI